jgi:peptidoglycan/xylan/chitin deacetylase (PgdA/CDA1 family)
MAIIVPPRILRAITTTTTKTPSYNPHRRFRPTRMLLKLLTLTLLFILFLVIFFAYIVYKPPKRLISALASQYPDVLWRVDGLDTSPSHPKIIALTIDDAPSDHTSDILAVLAKWKAHATFFVIGGQVKSEKERSRLVEMVRAGHELGNHAMHDEPAINLETGTLVEQIQSVNDLLKTAYRTASASTASGAGEGTVSNLAQTRPPAYFRPGSGFFSKRMRDTLAKLGYKLVLGDVYPHDPQIHNPNVNARHVISMVKTGSVVICHDRRSWTAPMLETVLSDLVGKKGYEIATVTRLLEVGEKERKKGARIMMGGDVPVGSMESGSRGEEDKGVDGHGHVNGKGQDTIDVVKDSEVVDVKKETVKKVMGW